MCQLCACILHAKETLKAHHNLEQCAAQGAGFCETTIIVLGMTQRQLGEFNTRQTQCTMGFLEIFGISWTEQVNRETLLKRFPADRKIQTFRTQIKVGRLYSISVVYSLQTWRFACSNNPAPTGLPPVHSCDPASLLLTSARHTRPQLPQQWEEQRKRRDRLILLNDLYFSDGRY